MFLIDERKSLILDQGIVSLVGNENQKSRGNSSAQVNASPSGIMTLQATLLLPCRLALLWERQREREREEEETIKSGTQRITVQLPESPLATLTSFPALHL